MAIFEMRIDGADYKKYIQQYCYGNDKYEIQEEEQYEWDKGIAP